MTPICIIGEAWGEAEERERRPFVGASGYELTKMLSEAGIDRADCFLTNVFNLKPPSNRMEALCGPKSLALPGYPALTGSKHIRAEFAPELLRLGDELITINPNVVICLGNTALWAMLGKAAISKLRGTTDTSTHTASGFKVLPTYHPAAVLRQWELRPTVVLDLMKAARESAFPEVRRPHREIWIEPTLEDLHEFERRFLQPPCQIAVDIETAGNQITCIGFARGGEVAIVIPFLDTRRANRCYWGDIAVERDVWGYIKRVLSNKAISKVFQNGMYDLAFLWRSYGVKVMGAKEDTMLLHHALQPEALKGLGYLGSIYADEGAWKHMRVKHETIKADE